jgi:hypothetical protein
MYNCPECSNEVNMIIEIITEQKSSFYNRLPSRISLTPITSLNSSWVMWDKPIRWICPHCLRQGKDMETDCVYG